MSTLRATNLCTHQRSRFASPLRSWGLKSVTPINRPCLLATHGAQPNACAARDLLPQIAPFSMHALTRPARRDQCPRYVRPTSACIKGATLCLHFVRGVPNSITNKWGQHYCRPHLFVINSKGYPTHRGGCLRAGHRLRYLQCYHHPISVKLQALTQLPRLPLP